MIDKLPYAVQRGLCSLVTVYYPACLSNGTSEKEQDLMHSPGLRYDAVTPQDNSIVFPDVTRVPALTPILASLCDTGWRRRMRVGWSDGRRQRDRRHGGIVIMSWEGRKDGKVEWAPKKQVWGKAGLALPPPSPAHASIAGSGTGEGAEEPGNQRLSFLSVTSDLPLLSLSPSSCVNKAGRQADTEKHVR